MFEDTISLIKGMSDLVDPPIFFDVLLGFVSPSDDVSIASFMDLSIFFSKRLSLMMVSLYLHPTHPLHKHLILMRLHDPI